MAKTLRVKVVEIKGNCPVYKVGQIFYIKDGYILESSVKLCMHSLASIMPYYVALSKGITPQDLNLGDKDKAYVQCLDPVERTGGGTVTFEIALLEKK
jgi:uncharacterized repeat protein (TIGR04076 family)